eukprot:scaffold13371_cov47-Attheya_sp.AAC.5
MKVETPQILWHNGADSDNGKAAPLMSLSMIESGITDIESAGKAPKYGTVLVTAGNTTEINVWRLGLRHTSNHGASTAAVGVAAANGGLLQHDGPPYSTKIELMLSLNRHERTVNAVKFSPDGLHLLTAGDGGSIVVWSVPVSKRGNDNGRHYWSTLERENDLTCRVVSGASEDILDVSWSADSKRFVAGSLDHCVMVYEDACTNSTEESQWTCVYRNAKDHTHYVQGVSYDPLGVYVASMGSDRTARVYARKQPSALKTPKKKKNHTGPPLEERALAPSNLANTEPQPPPPPPSMEDKEQEELRKRETVQRVLTESKFELGKAKTLKYRYDATGDASVEAGTNTTTNTTTMINSGKKHHLFCDETTVESFFRRLSWTTDGAFLVAPAALWHGHGSANVVNGNEAKPEHEGTTTGGTVSSPTFATYLFARHRFDKPIRVLAGLEKPSVVVRPNPVLFKLPESQMESTKENQALDLLHLEAVETRGHPATTFASSPALAYRSIFAVLTLDSIILYDTHHLEPLCVARGLHYAGLTDCVWSPDGMNLLVTSTDGYVSILGFDDGELGEVYTPPKAKQMCPVNHETTVAVRMIQPNKAQALGG